MLTAPDPKMPLIRLPTAINIAEIIALNAAPCPFPKLAKPAPSISAAPTSPLLGMPFTSHDKFFHCVVGIATLNE